MRGSCALLVIVSMVCAAADAFAAEPANLAPVEKSLLASGVFARGASAASKPIHYVAPWIAAREHQGTAPSGLNGAGAIRAYLQKSRPSLPRPSAVLTNGGFEDGNFNGWTLSGALGSSSPSVCGA